MYHYILISQTLSIIYLYRDVSSQYLPGAYPMAPQMAPMRMPMPAAVQAPIAPMMPMPMPAPAMPYPMVSQQKLPVVVMPFYSKSANHQKREKKRPGHKRRPKNRNFRRNFGRYHSASVSGEGSSSCDSASSESSNEYEPRSNKRTKLKNTRRQVLTPVVSYVTKDGYVIYQKKIRKDKARDWLQLGEKDRVTQKSNEVVESDDEGHSHGSRKSRSSHHQH